jgi:branched-chain amino acid transport system ATP-binding protein
MLSVQNLRSGYGRIPILTGINFEVATGEYLGILGHNGMGKSTLMRTLMGYIPATSGSIQLEGRDITRTPTSARATVGMGFVPQGREIFPNLSVLENLRMGLAASPREKRCLIDEILEEFPRIKPLLERRGGALSGGEQQLLALARCLCMHPKIIFLDEPTEGVQPSIVDEIVETLLRLRTGQDITMILVEQNLEFITALSQRILTIQKGRITGTLRPDQLQDPNLVTEFVGMG